MKEDVRLGLLLLRAMFTALGERRITWAPLVVGAWQQGASAFLACAWGPAGAAAGEDHDQFDTHWWSVATPAAGRAIVPSRNPNVALVLASRLPLMSTE